MCEGQRQHCFSRTGKTYCQSHTYCRSVKRSSTHSHKHTPLVFQSAHASDTDRLPCPAPTAAARALKVLISKCGRIQADNETRYPLPSMPCSSRSQGLRVLAQEMHYWETFSFTLSLPLILFLLPGPRSASRKGEMPTSLRKPGKVPSPFMQMTYHYPNSHIHSVPSHCQLFSLPSFSPFTSHCALSLQHFPPFLLFKNVASLTLSLHLLFPSQLPSIPLSISHSAPPQILSLFPTSFLIDGSPHPYFNFIPQPVPDLQEQKLPLSSCSQPLTRWHLPEKGKILLQQRWHFLSLAVCVAVPLQLFDCKKGGRRLFFFFLHIHSCLSCEFIHCFLHHKNYCSLISAALIISLKLI